MTTTPCTGVGNVAAGAAIAAIEVAHGQAERRSSGARPAGRAPARAGLGRDAVRRAGRSVSLTGDVCARAVAQHLEPRDACPAARPEMSRISSSSVAIGAAVDADDDVVGRSPARSAGESGVTSCTSAPRVDRQPQRALQLRRRRR